MLVPGLVKIGDDTNVAGLVSAGLKQYGQFQTPSDVCGFFRSIHIDDFQA